MLVARVLLELLAGSGLLLLALEIEDGAEREFIRKGCNELQ